MSLADIKAKINAEAQAQIKTIEAENDARVSAVIKEADNEVKAIQSSYKNRFAKEDPEILKRRQIVAGLDANKVDLGIKQRLIGEAFEGALRKLTELPHDAYLSFVHTLMEKAVVTGEEVLFIGQNERNIDGSWLDSYNASHSTRLSFSGDRLPISGGFVLRNGKIDINCSWDMLMEAIRSEIEPDVVQRLFSQ
ncbi:MAG: V-type ATP synthase subunit E [Synergistaceae bacterium]|jgi:V/A-type H+-transporting ATPase subunit E|nr:V-type ATP synthase subunit E [Synergistaceae bacterium]